MVFECCFEAKISRYENRKLSWIHDNTAMWLHVFDEGICSNVDDLRIMRDGKVDYDGWILLEVPLVKQLSGKQSLFADKGKFLYSIFKNAWQPNTSPESIDFPKW